MESKRPTLNKIFRKLLILLLGLVGNGLPSRKKYFEANLPAHLDLFEEFKPSKVQSSSSPSPPSSSGINIVHCSLYNNYSNRCIECVEGYFPSIPDGVQCVKCGLGCQKCSSDTSCTFCEPYFYPKNGLCYKCPFPCKRCAQYNICLSCFSEYTLYEDSACVKNSSNSYLIFEIILISAIFLCILLTCVAITQAYSKGFAKRRVINRKKIRKIIDDKVIGLKPKKKTQLLENLNSPVLDSLGRDKDEMICQLLASKKTFKEDVSSQTWRRRGESFGMNNISIIESEQ